MRVYQVNIFLVPPKKHMLWVLIGKALLRSIHNISFCGQKKKNNQYVLDPFINWSYAIVFMLNIGHLITLFIFGCEALLRSTHNISFCGQKKKKNQYFLVEKKKILSLSGAMLLYLC